jgi:two-component system sensor histidine kinase TorS
MLGLGERRELPTVLLIDDDYVTREVIATILTMHGFMVYTANEGAESLTLLDNGTCTPAIVLMDAQMPGIVGIDLIEQLRRRCKADIYVISGSRPPDNVLEAANGFLLKPFNPDDLKKLLHLHAPEPLPDALDPEEPVLNPQVLAQFRQLMPERAVREIYASVITDLKKRTNAIEAAISNHQAYEVRRIGHSIKGGCGMAGAVQAARLGAIFEAESDQLDNSTTALQHLRDAAANLERMLENEFPV